MKDEFKRALGVGLACSACVLFACGDGASESNGENNAESSDTQQTSGTAGETTTGGSEESAQSFDVATPDGAARVLIAAVSEGRFEDAALVVAPDSPGKLVLDQFVDMQKTYESKEDKAALDQVVRKQLLDTMINEYKSAGVELVTVEGDAAIVSITRPSLGDLPSVPVMKSGDLWLVSIPEGFITMDNSKAGSMAETLGGADPGSIDSGNGS